MQSNWHEAREHRADVIFAGRDSRENTDETLGPAAGESPRAIEDILDSCLAYSECCGDEHPFDERDFAVSFWFPSDCPTHDLMWKFSELLHFMWKFLRCSRPWKSECALCNRDVSQPGDRRGRFMSRWDVHLVVHQ